jgi:S1-C subfamily serine protease
MALRLPLSLSALVAVCSGLFLSSAAADVGAGYYALQARVAELYRQHASAVVRVKVATEELDAEGNQRVSLLVFSGFFVSRDGRVLTNSSAVGRASRIWIEQDGLSYLAESIGNDPNTNVGLLQVLKLPERFAFIPLPESPETPVIGSMALAITSPLEFDPSPSLGLVTGFESRFANFVFPFTYTRIGIPGGPAEGGSPVLDLSGKLMGITVASVPEIRSTYIVPSRALARIKRDLETHRRVNYGWLPVEFLEQPDRLNFERQIVVAEVQPGSSAELAGLRAGDVLRAVGGEPAGDLNALRDRIFYARIGDFLMLGVEREGRNLEFALPVEPRPPPAPPPSIAQP